MAWGDCEVEWEEEGEEGEEVLELDLDDFWPVRVPQSDILTCSSEVGGGKVGCVLI